MYLISAYFDENATKILDRYINYVAEATGNHFMKDHRVPAHMTIAAIEARSAQVLMEPFHELERELTRGGLRFVSVGALFPYVLYATPLMNDYLRDFNRKVFEKIELADSLSEDHITVNKCYRPNQWLPHVTLGKTLDKDQMRAAFAAMQQHFVPFSADLVKLGLSRVNPHEDLVRYRLR